MSEMRETLERIKQIREYFANVTIEQFEQDMKDCGMGVIKPASEYGYKLAGSDKAIDQESQPQHGDEFATLLSKIPPGGLLEHCYDDEGDYEHGGEWVVFKQSGSINDWEYVVLGYGATPLEALRSAFC